jgi:hypothetical protein
MANDAYDNAARRVNELIATGWNPSSDMWKGMSQIMLGQDEIRNLPVWGLREKIYVPKGLALREGIKQEYDIVANATLFDKHKMVGSLMTYDEAVALKKMMES